MTAIEAGVDRIPKIDLAVTRRAVDQALGDFLLGKTALADCSDLGHVIDLLRDYLLTGGKRLRSLLCYCGWRAAGGTEMYLPAIHAAASFELFHAFALIHDDIMDSATVRRGRPALHRSLAIQHRHRGDPATVDRLGTNSAILIGDLTMVWSDELLHSSGMSVRQLAAVRPALDAMRSELMFGQYLDLLGAGTFSGDVEEALTIARYKSGKYTVERPLHIGATLAGAEHGVLEACTAYGLPIGEAFQLRDDLLGIFGDPAVTGKSRLDDLREGKRTVLLAIALRDADPATRGTLVRSVGDPALDEDGAETIRQVMLDTGAVAAVEGMIAERLRRGLAVLDDAPFQPVATAALREIAHAATVRTG